MLSLRPGKLLVAGWVVQFMDDPSIVAPEMGHCPLAAPALRRDHVKEQIWNQDVDTTWRVKLLRFTIFEIVTRNPNTGHWRFLFEKATRIDSWMLASSSFMGLEVTSQCNIRTWLIAMVSYIIIIKDVLLIPWYCKSYFYLVLPLFFICISVVYVNLTHLCMWNRCRVKCSCVCLNHIFLIIDMIYENVLCVWVFSFSLKQNAQWL